VSTHFNQVCKLSLVLVRQFLVMKQEDNEARFYSPTKLMQDKREDKLKAAKTSKRLQTLRAEDPYMKIDLADHFVNNMQKSMTSLGLQNIA